MTQVEFRSCFSSGKDDKTNRAFLMAGKRATLLFLCSTREQQVLNPINPLKSVELLIVVFDATIISTYNDAESDY